MSDLKVPLRPGTEVLTRGFDPSLSGAVPRVPRCFAVRPTCFPARKPPSAPSTSWPAAARRNQARRSTWFTSRFNHPNAEILEDQILPLEEGAKAALVFNSGMAAIMTAMLDLPQARFDRRLHRADLRRHPALHLRTTSRSGV